MKKKSESNFSKLIKKFVLKNNIFSKKDTIDKAIDDILINNDLAVDEHVPYWLTHFFEALVNQQIIKRQRFDPKAVDKQKGDVANFLAELELIVEAKWDDYGEGIEIELPNIGMCALILFEGFVYQVDFLDKQKKNQ